MVLDSKGTGKQVVSGSCSWWPPTPGFQFSSWWSATPSSSMRCENRASVWRAVEPDWSQTSTGGRSTSAGCFATSSSGVPFQLVILMYLHNNNLSRQKTPEIDVAPWRRHDGATGGRMDGIGYLRVGWGMRYRGPYSPLCAESEVRILSTLYCSVLVLSNNLLLSTN